MPISARLFIAIWIGLHAAFCHVVYAAEPIQVPKQTAGDAPSSAEISIEPKFFKNIRQVTRGMVKAGEGYFSPDGKTIIYQAVPQGYPFYQIYSQPLLADTGKSTEPKTTEPKPIEPKPIEPQLLSTGRGRTTCSYFHPDGKSILFASSHLDMQLSKTEDDARQQQADDKKSGTRRRYQWDFDPATEIFAADLDGKNLRRLTDSKGYDAEGAYSKDGKLIAFCSDRDGDPDLYVMNADGSNQRQLTNEPGYDGGPFISPNGKWVLFRSDRKKESFLQIHAIGIDGKHDTALTDNIGVNWAPYWHPTEPYIIWTGADHTNPKARPNYDLWLLKYEELADKIVPVGKPIRITDNAAADVLPVFSPDGKQLMWTSNRTADRESQLFIADFQLDAAK